MKFHSQDVEKAIRFYRNLNETDRNYEFQLQNEMKKLDRSSDDDEAVQQQQQKPKPSLFKWSDLIVGPGGKAMLIGAVLMVLNQFSGCYAMLQYTSNIFKEAGTAVPSNVAAIIVGIIQLIGSLFPVFLVDRIGRKVCMQIKAY